jgi:hypothetical protein
MRATYPSAHFATSLSVIGVTNRSVAPGTIVLLQLTVPSRISELRNPAKMARMISMDHFTRIVSLDHFSFRARKPAKMLHSVSVDQFTSSAECNRRKLNEVLLLVET